MCHPLCDIIAANPLPVPLNLGWVNVPALHNRVLLCEEAACPIGDEQVLTYLCAYGYAIHANGPQLLSRILLEDDALAYTDSFWFEFLPPPTREAEGATHLDLSFGHLQRRGRTFSGIEFAPPNSGSWVGIVEAKLLSDIACDVEYDPFRNQLLRVIETAATLRSVQGAVPEKVHVVLLTPKVFREHPKSRFYGCKFEEYCGCCVGHLGAYDPDVDAIRRDLDRLRLGAIYPQDIDIECRLQSLKLHWVTYEDVIRNIPAGDFRDGIHDLVNREGGILDHVEAAA
jgi:hypothetical protein